MVYDVSGFLDKNKDTLFQDFKRLLYSSKDPNIRHMWPEGAQDIHKVNQRFLCQIEIVNRKGLKSFHLAESTDNV